MELPTYSAIFVPVFKTLIDLVTVKELRAVRLLDKVNSMASLSPVIALGAILDVVMAPNPIFDVVTAPVAILSSNTELIEGYIATLGKGRRYATSTISVPVGGASVNTRVLGLVREYVFLF